MPIPTNAIKPVSNATIPAITPKSSGPITINVNWLVSQVISAIAGFLGNVLQGAGDKLAWFATYLPTPSSLPNMSVLYSIVLQASLLLFALALIIQLIFSLLGKATFSPSDAVITIFAMLFGLNAYDYAASAANSTALYVLNSNLGGASAAQILVLESGAMAVIPFLNVLFFLAIAEYAVMAVFRIIATATLACSIPIVALLWMVPPTKGLARDFFDGLALLILLSPISAIFLSLGMGAALDALHGSNPFLDFALSTGTLLGISVLPVLLARGGGGALEAGRSALRRRSLT